MYILDLLRCVTMVDSTPAWMSFILNLFMHFLLILYLFSFSINLCVSTIRFWYPLTLKNQNKNKLFYPLLQICLIFLLSLTHTHTHTHLITVLKFTFVKWSTGCWIVSYVSVTEQRKIEIVQFITHRSYRKYMAPPRGHIGRTKQDTDRDQQTRHRAQYLY